MLSLDLLWYLLQKGPLRYFSTKSKEMIGCDWRCDETKKSWKLLELNPRTFDDEQLGPTIEPSEFPKQSSQGRNFQPPVVDGFENVGSAFRKMDVPNVSTENTCDRPAHKFNCADNYIIQLPPAYFETPVGLILNQFESRLQS